MRRLRTLSLALLCAATLVAASASGKTIRVGGKNFTEQFLLAAMTSKYLTSKGFNVTLKTGLGTVLMRQALEENQLDMVWDYTGTALIVYHHLEEKITGDASYQKAKELDKPNNLVWLDPADLDNGYALTMPREIAEKEGIDSIEDLAQRIKEEQKTKPKKKHLFGVDFEFASRPDGLKPLQEAYEFKFKRRDIKQMDPGLVYTALKNHQIFVGLAFTSDGRIKGFNLKALKDNRGFFPSYYATPVIRKEVLEKHPELEQLMRDLTSRLTTEGMMELNKKVDIDHLSIDRVAEDFLREQGLI